MKCRRSTRLPARVRAALALLAAGGLAACSSGAIAALALGLNGGHRRHHGSNENGSQNQVVLSSDLFQDGRVELFAAPFDGSFQEGLSGSIVGGGKVKRFAISPDRTRVLFLAAKDDPAVDELYVVDLRSTAPPLKIHPDLRHGQGVRDFRWAPDSSRIAYVAQQSDCDHLNLYSSRGDGSANVKLLPDDAGAVAFPVSDLFDGTVAAFDWSPDSRYLACATHDGWKGKYSLFTMTPDGSVLHKIAPTDRKLSGLPLWRRFERPWLPFAWSTNASLPDYLAYLTDAESDEGVHGSQLRIASFDGSDDRRLGFRFDQGNKDPDDVRFQWAPDGSRIAFVSDSRIADRYQLWSCDPKTSDPDDEDLEISNNLGDAAYDVEWYGRDAFEWAPDSSRVAFRGDLDVAGLTELYSADPTIDQPPNDKINVALKYYGQAVVAFRWSPDAKLVAYIDDENKAGTFELFTAGPTGTGRNVVSRIDSKKGGDVLFAPDRNDPAYSAFDHPIAWSPDSRRLAYLADQEVDGVFEPFAAMSDGSNNFRLSKDLAGVKGDCCRVLWIDSASLLYAADERERGRIELMSARTDGPTGTILTGAANRGGTVCPDVEVR